MKKLYSLFLAVFFMSIFSINLKAQDAGIFETYVILNVNNSGVTFYDAQAETANLDFEGANLGTFNNSQALTFVGGQVKTYKNSGADVTGANVHYAIYAGARPTELIFTDLVANFKSDDGDGNQTWEKSDNAANLVAGLANGAYTLEIYFDATTSLGLKYSSNNGANFKSTFVVDNSSLSVSNLVGNKRNSFVAGGKLYTKMAGNLDIAVYDMTGKVVQKSHMKATDEDLNLNVLQTGTYIVKVSNGSQTETLKFIK